MKKDIENYKKIHIIKFKLGILAAILIIGVFGTIYCGATKITYGNVPDKFYNEYLLYPQSLKMNNDPNVDIIGFSNRIYSVDTQSNETYGVDNNNSIMILNSNNGSVEWKYVLNQPNFVINKFSLLNYEQASNQKMDPLFFVQYSQVSGGENRANYYSDSNTQDYARNETGYYESYIIKGFDENPVVSNLTSTIKDRVTNVFLLKYNPNDNEPDFLVETANTTYQNSQSYSLYLSNSSYSSTNANLYSFYANGTLAWKVNTTDSYFNEQDEEEYNLNAQIDSNHYAMIQNYNNLAVFDLNNGSEIWNTSQNNNTQYSDISFQNVFATYRDYNLDGIMDVGVQFINNTDNCSYLGFLDGSNGQFLSNPGIIKTNYSSSLDLYESTTLSPNDPHFILTFNQPFTGCSIYKIGSNGINLIRTIDFSNLQQNYAMLSAQNVFVENNSLYFSFQGQQQGDNNSIIFLINLTSGKLVGNIQSSSETYVINDLNSNYPGPECAFLDYNGQGYFYISMMPKMPYFEASESNTILFISFIVLIGLSTVLLLKNRSEFIPLIRTKKEYKDEHKSEYKENDVNIHFEEKERDNQILDEKKAKSIKQINKIALICLIVLLAGMIGFVIFSFYQASDQSNIYGSDNYLALRNVYITIALLSSSLAIISILYNHISSISAILHIKIQKRFYKLMSKNIDYRVVVLDMNYGKKYSPFVILERSLFPILVSLTIGLAIFQAISNQTIGTVSGQINLKWIAQFELIAGLTFILAYIAIIFIIPGAWLLDDCGVVYFNEPIETIAPGDISKISNWLLNWLKGLFGFTTILNYYNLFKNFNFFAASNQVSPFMSIILLILVFGVLLILSPILYGLIAMLYSNTSMISDLEYNKQKLFNKMESMGISTKSHKLRDFFEHKE